MNASLTMWNSNNNGCYSYEADGYFHFKKSQSGPLHLPEGRNSGSCIKSTVLWYFICNSQDLFWQLVYYRKKNYQFVAKLRNILFNRTVQNEFYAIAFRKKIYTSIEQLQADLDTWMNSHSFCHTAWQIRFWSKCQWRSAAQSSNYRLLKLYIEVNIREFPPPIFISLP